MQNPAVGKAVIIIARALVDLLEGDEKNAKLAIETALTLRKYKIR